MDLVRRAITDVIVGTPPTVHRAGPRVPPGNDGGASSARTSSSTGP
jgi:hypothetical protein